MCPMLSGKAALIVYRHVLETNFSKALLFLRLGTWQVELDAPIEALYFIKIPPLLFQN